MQIYRHLLLYHSHPLFFIICLFSDKKAVLTLDYCSDKGIFSRLFLCCHYNRLSTVRDYINAILPLHNRPTLPNDLYVSSSVKSYVFL